MPAKQPATRRYKSMQRRAVVKKPQANVHRNTAIQQCVHAELSRYYEMLDGEAPLDLYRMVMQQTEAALLTSVLEECRGNHVTLPSRLFTEFSGQFRSGSRQDFRNLGKSKLLTSSATQASLSGTRCS